LCHIICTQDAAIPIKCYSPELIVHPLLSTSDDAIRRICTLLMRLDVLVVGPGLGREPAVLALTKDIIRSAKAMQLPLLLDGDALFLLSTDPELIHGYSRAILTPNMVEFARLCVATGLLTDLKSSVDTATTVPPQMLAQRLGHVVVLQKGKVDTVSDGITSTNTMKMR
jgi:ATP-dependent NAD(P)H-hydrate dehydratase